MLEHFPFEYRITEAEYTPIPNCLGNLEPYIQYAGYPTWKVFGKAFYLFRDPVSEFWTISGIIGNVTDCWQPNTQNVINDTYYPNGTVENFVNVVPYV